MHCQRKLIEVFEIFHYDFHQLTTNYLLNAITQQ